MNKNFITLALILIVLTAGGVFLFRGGNAGEESASKTPSPAGKTDLDRFSAIALTDYDGNAVSLGGYRSKPLVVNAWAVWCPFCRAELADFAALQEEFPDIAVIAIDRAEGANVARSFTDELGITDMMTFLLDPKDDFYRQLGGFSMPETIFISKEGRIVFHKRGPMTLPEMRAFVNEHLQ